MRAYDAETVAALQRGDVVARLLLWIVAKNRDTGDPEAAGWWTGEQARKFTIGGDERLYHAAGGLLGSDPIVAEVGLDVRMHRIVASPISPEVAEAIRGHDVRLAPVELHRVLFDVVKAVPVAPPHRLIKGFVDGLDIVTAAVGGESQAVLTVATSTRRLTRTLTSMMSDASFSRRGGDRIMRYSDLGEVVDVPWGE